MFQYHFLYTFLENTFLFIIFIVLRQRLLIFLHFNISKHPFILSSSVPCVKQREREREREREKERERELDNRGKYEIVIAVGSSVRKT